MKPTLPTYLVALAALGGLALKTEAWARRSELSLDKLELARAGLPMPQSASFVNLEKRTGEELAGLCPTKGFHLQPKKLAGDEPVSRALRVRFVNARPELDECIRGHACFPLAPEKQNIDPRKQTKFTFNGRAGSYQISIDAAAEISSRPINCTSSAVEILQNSQGQMKLPSSVWVLNFRNEIVLWDGIEKRPWYRIKFPTNQTFSAHQNVSIDSSGRMLVVDENQSFLFADFLLDKALLKTSDALFESSFGVGGIAYSAEWQMRHTTPFSFEKNTTPNQPGSKPSLFLGLLGFAKGEEFWTWENAFKALSASGGKSFSLGAPLVAGTERIIGDVAEVFLAVRNSANSADILSYSTNGVAMRTVRANQRLDERAQNTHFLIIGNELYRHTADGIYKVDSATERPSNLKGFKGSVEPNAHFILTRQAEGKNCTLNIWPVTLVFSGLFEPIIGPIGCSSALGLGVSPWGTSATWRTGQQIKTILSTND
jgi:hypothetical protein